MNARSGRGVGEPSAALSAVSRWKTEQEDWLHARPAFDGRERCAVFGRLSRHSSSGSAPRNSRTSAQASAGVAGRSRRRRGGHTSGTT
jgi:hypothetical protein